MVKYGIERVVLLKIFLIKCCVLFSLVFLLISFSLNVYGHEVSIDVVVDDCNDNITGDGIDETWFIIDAYDNHYGDNEFYYSKHIGEESLTLKYYIHNRSKYDSSYLWTTDVSYEMAEEIKAAYVNSMLKWNDVYFYFYNGNTSIVKEKIINIVEGTENDNNINIYPIEYSFGGPSYIAATGEKGSGICLENASDLKHFHYQNWDMHVNVHYFYVHNELQLNFVNAVREMTGMHEVGHVLGLWDIDEYCSSKSEPDHHHEVLMGYGEELENRSMNVSYKDIAGVAITRGFHTDEDHKWLIDWDVEYEENNGFKLICSICNGVKYIHDPSGYVYSEYGVCNNNHSLSSGNMFAVASYQNKDYYKCKHCRYVAPFGDIITQNYSYTDNDSTNHIVTNNVTGLYYTFVENHYYDLNPVWINNTQHSVSCACGKLKRQGHAVISGSNRCITCGGIASSGILKPTASSIVFRSENGSVILANGIIILVQDDVESYLNGTLEFNSNNSNFI